MRGHYSFPTQTCREELKNIVDIIIEKVTSEKDEDGFSLNPLDASPSLIIDIVKELGYEEVSSDVNGWEGDTWIYYSKPDSPQEGLCLFYTAYTFNMSISYCTFTEEE